MFRRFLGLTLVLGLLGATGGEARADLKYTNLKKADWQNYLDTFTPMGFRITNWDIRVVNGEPRYDLEMAKLSGPPWRIRTGVTSDQFESLAGQMAGQGYVIRKHKAYSVNGVLLNAAMFERR